MFISAQFRAINKSRTLLLKLNIIVMFRSEDLENKTKVKIWLQTRKTVSGGDQGRIARGTFEAEEGRGKGKEVKTTVKRREDYL